MQKLWGRLCYNPDTKDELFKNHLAHTYPGVSGEKLFDAYTKSSQAMQLAIEQVTGSWSLDMYIWPEAWIGSSNWGLNKGYLTLGDTQDSRPMNGSDLCAINTTADGNCGGDTPADETIDKIETLALGAISTLGGLGAGGNKDLEQALKDLYALSYLALYDAHKYRAALYKEQNKNSEAQFEIGTAYCYWKTYADLMDGMYTGADMQRVDDFPDWHSVDDNALKDYTDAGGSGTPNCSVSVGDGNKKLKINNNKAELWIYNIHGKLVTVVNVKSGTSHQSQALSTLRSSKTLSDGIYLIVIKSRNIKIGMKKVNLVN